MSEKTYFGESGFGSCYIQPFVPLVNENRMKPQRFPNQPILAFVFGGNEGRQQGHSLSINGNATCGLDLEVRVNGQHMLDAEVPNAKRLL
jgi:hypothetical protein